MPDPVQDAPAFARVLELLDEQPILGFDPGVPAGTRGEPGQWIVADADGVIARGTDLATVLRDVSDRDPDLLAVGFIGPPDRSGTAGGGGGPGRPIDPLFDIREVGAFTSPVYAAVGR